MSLLNYLQTQKIDDFADELRDNRLIDDRIDLDDKIDEASLERFWDSVVADIHEDPEWSTFDDK